MAYFKIIYHFCEFVIPPILKIKNININICVKTESLEGN